MTDNQILKWLSEVQGLVLLICCILGFLFSKRLNKPVKFFCYYLFFSLVMNYSMSKMADLRVNNLAITHFMVLGEFIFLSAFFRQVLSNNIILNKYFKYYLAIIGGFIIVNTLYLETINTFNTNAKVVVLFIILFFATNFFYNRSKQLMEVDVHEKAIRLINSALLLYYSGSFFVYLFYKFTQNNKLFYSDKMLIFNAGLYLTFTLIILIALLQIVVHRKITQE